MSVIYLIARNNASGRAEATRRGWKMLAYARFATPERDDVRLVTRFSEMVPMPNLRLARGADFDAHPEAKEFDGFVEEGLARWLEP